MSPTHREKKEGKIERCPFCNYSNGYYKKVYMKGRSQYNYTFGGTEAHNDELHSGITYRENKSCFCLKCDKNLTKYINL